MAGFGENVSIDLLDAKLCIRIFHFRVSPVSGFYKFLGNGSAVAGTKYPPCRDDLRIDSDGYECSIRI
jgi:hypothetical protein